MSERTNRPATDNEVALWHCEKCVRSGALLMDPHADVYSVVNALENAHRELSPQCDTLSSLRMTKPNDWFKSVTDLAERHVKRGGAA